ncbi:hypothetical protein Tco_0644777 [Tanacetum coccineum]
MHEEPAVSYADLGSSIEGYHAENVDHKEQTHKLEAIKDDPALNKKVIEATKAYTKNSTNLIELLTLVKHFDFYSLMSAVESLKATTLSQDKYLAEWAKSSTSMAWNLGPRVTAIENSQAAIRTKVSSLKSYTSKIKSMMTEIYNTFKGQPFSAPSGSVSPTLAITYVLASVKGENDNTATEEPPSHTEREHADMETDTEKPESEKAVEEPKHAIPISTVKPIKTSSSEVPPITTIISTSLPESSRATKRTDKGKGIATKE